MGGGGQRVESAERRHGARAHTHGSVFVHTSNGVRGRVVDISAGGVRFELGGEPDSRVDQRVELDIRLDGRRPRWVHVGGRVMRVANRTVVVCFFDTPTDFEDTIQNELVSELAAGGDDARRVSRPT